MKEAKKDLRYPVLSDSEKEKLKEAFAICLGDFQAGRKKSLAMARISKDAWIINTGVYYKNAIAGIKYLASRLSMKIGD